ncbi:hypothetical protein EON65_21025 [archaeon]|nr:MAG: hypothetical protein EON65_21025 [archaeon]
MPSYFIALTAVSCCRILSSGWNPQKNVEVIIDPLCGSGTVPIEAALIMANTAPGLVRYNTDRKIPCPAQWLDIDEQHWKDSNVDAVAADQRIYLKERLKKPLIFANDINDKALALAKLAAKEAGVLNLISFSQQCVSRLPHPDVYKPLPKTPVKVITNPPWDRRLDDSTKGSWRQLNVFLRKLKGTANILSGDTSLFRYLDSYEDVGKMPMKIGNVDVEARSFAMHSIL